MAAWPPELATGLPSCTALSVSPGVLIWLSSALSMRKNTAKRPVPRASPSQIGCSNTR